jgi:predicted phosphodiesterase
MDSEIKPITVREWLNTRADWNKTREDIITDCVASLGVTPKHVREIFNEIEDFEIRKFAVKSAKQQQKFQDINRIERKSFRQYARIENAVSEYTKELLSIFDKYNLSIATTSHDVLMSDHIGIVQVSDTHFNEIIDITSNSYDFNVASCRLKKFASHIKTIFGAYNIKKVLLAMTGDLINSDRRLDEILSECTNRANATFIAVDLLQQFILDLNTEFNIDIAYVSGNESRVKDEYGWIDEVATDNYDSSIFNILKYIFNDKAGISFITSDPMEAVVNIFDTNVLMLHGHSLNKNLDHNIKEIIGQYTQKGISISYVIFGHIHSAYLSDFFARSSSLCGANAYSDKSLHCASKASQNIHIVGHNNEIHSIKIDLQTVNKNVKYNIDKSLLHYASKGTLARSKNITIHKM